MKGTLHLMKTNRVFNAANTNWLQPQPKNILNSLTAKSFKWLGLLGLFILMAGFATNLSAQTTQTFSYTGSSQTFTVPTGVTSITIYGWGAGGGSGGAVAANNDNASGGGGGGATAKSIFTVSSGQMYTINVGAGGTAGANTGTAGGTGGTTTVTGTAGTVTALGGGGGGGVTVTTGAAGTAGSGAVAGTGGFAGGNGTVGVRTTQNEVGGAGGGGAGIASAGGNGTSTNAGTNTVGGTGGTGSPNSTPYIGGSGAGASTTTGTNAGVSGNAPGGGAAGAATFSTAAAGAVGGAGQVVIVYTSPAAPTLTASPNPSSVDNNFTVTTTTAYAGAITSIQIGAIALTSGTDYSISAGVITFTPSATGNASLRTPGTYTFTVNATGYSAGSFSETLTVGAANKLAIKTQPAAPATNGAVLATQPAVYVLDKYGNVTASTATVTATVGAGSYTLGGTTGIAAVSGTATYTNLTATSTAAVTGATITFTSTGLTSVTSGTFNIPAPPPSNDLCSGAIAIPATGPFPYLTATVDITNATSTGDPTPSCQTSSNHGIWYTFTPTVTGTYTFSTCSSVTSTTVSDDILSIYTGTCGGTLTSFACNDDATTTLCSANGNLAIISNVTLTAGTTYLILASGYSTNVGNIQIQVTYTAPPTITSFSPTFACTGSGASVTITGTNFTGATSVKFNGITATYTVSSATSISTTLPSGATTGTITVVTPGGIVTSSANFTVNPLPTGVISGTQNVCSGNSANLSIAVTGIGPWNGTITGGIPFSGSSSPITVSVSPTATTTYQILTLSDANCTAIAAGKTGSAIVTVQTAPVAAFTGSPTSVTTGGSVTFTDQSTQTPTAWSWSFPGGTPSTSTVQNPVVTYNTVGTYSVTLIATNNCGSNTLTKTNYIIVTNLSSPQTYSSSGSFVVPPGVTCLKVEAWGGGGSGGGTAGTLGTNVGSGGGGGAYNTTIFSVVSSQTYTVTVGGGGAGNSNAAGSSGTASTVSGTAGTLTANPGTGGAKNAGAAGTGGTGFNNGGNGGVGSGSGAGGGGGADNATPAGAGNGGNGTNTAAGAGGAGTSAGGMGGAIQSGSTDGNSGTSPGGGGGGARSSFDVAHVGGAGAAGQVVISFINASDFNVSATPTTICAGAAVTITMTSTTLINGSYDITYSTTNPNNSTGTATVTFTGGTASFTVNGLTGPTSSTVTINSVTSAGWTCNTLLTGKTATITVNSATVITANPLSTQTDCQNATPTTLSVTATGSGTLAYQWYSNTTNSNSGGTSLGSGVTSSTYTPSTTAAGTKYYYVTVTGTCGTATSATAAVIVNATTVITANPLSTQTDCQNATPTTLSIAATGSGTLAYQWYSNTTNSNSGGTSLGSGATSSTYTPSTTAAGTKYYYVTVTGTCGTATSATAAVIVNATTVITSNPTGATYCQGATATALSVTASGAGTLAYQWYSNTTNSNSGGTLISGATSSTYTPSTAAAGTTYYYVTVTGTCGTATSAIAAVTVNSLPVISSAVKTSHNGSDLSCSNSADGQITVTASGTGTLTYSDNNGSSYQASNIFSDLGAGTYAIVVKNSTGCTSAATTVTLTAPSAITATATQTSASCSGNSTGSVKLAGSGGTAPYSYTLGTTTQPSGNFSNLASGIYNYSVTDANNCIPATGSITVMQVTNTLTLNSGAHNPNCDSAGNANYNNGSFDLQGVGGTTPYAYAFNSGNTITGAYGSQQYYPNIPANTNYTLSVKDATGCVFIKTKQITRLTGSLSTSATDVNATTAQVCYGKTQAIFVSGHPGTAPYTWSINGGSFGSTRPNYVSSGTYSAVVKDAEGCTATTNSVIITQPSAPLAFTTQIQHGVCGAGRTVTVTATGGYGSYKYLLAAGAPNYSGTPTSGGSSYTFTNVTPGTYTVTVADVNGCSTSNVIHVTDDAAVPKIVVVTNSNTVNAGSTLTYSVSPVAGVTYTWSVPAGDQVVSGQGTATVQINWVTSGPLKLTASASCTTSTSQWEEYVTVTNGGGNPAIAATLLQQSKISVYPNPASDIATVVYTAIKEGKYTLSLSDVTGKTVVRQDAIANKGENFIKLNVGNYANGLYFIRLSDGSNTQTIKLVKAK